MKVVCIKEGNYNHKDGIVPRIIVGNFYTVLKEIEVEDDDYYYRLYVLEEMGEDNGYGKQNFSPVSNIDETEFVRDYNKETV